jgi:hypothetical protein
VSRTVADLRLQVKDLQEKFQTFERRFNSLESGNVTGGSNMLQLANLDSLKEARLKVEQDPQYRASLVRAFRNFSIIY